MTICMKSFQTFIAICTLLLSSCGIVQDSIEHEVDNILTADSQRAEVTLVNTEAYDAIFVWTASGDSGTGSIDSKTSNSFRVEAAEAGETITITVNWADGGSATELIYVEPNMETTVYIMAAPGGSI